MKTSVSKKQLYALLTEYSKSQAPEIFNKIENALPLQMPNLDLSVSETAWAKKPARTPRFLPAYIATAAICTLVVLICLHFNFFSAVPQKITCAPAEPTESNATKGPSVVASSTETGVLFGSNMPVSQPQKNAVTSQTAVSSSKNVGASRANGSSTVPSTISTSTGTTHSYDVTFGQDEAKVSGIYSGPMIPAFINYGSGIYSLEYNSDSIDQLKGETMGDLLTSNGSNYTFYSIKGIDPAKQIAVKIIYYYPCKYLCSNKVIFNGETYIIKDADETSLNFTGSDDTIPSNGKYLGKIGTISIYSINGVDPSKKIAVNYIGNCFADAVKQ